MYGGVKSNSSIKNPKIREFWSNSVKLLNAIKYLLSTFETFGYNSKNCLYSNGYVVLEIHTFLSPVRCIL